MFELLLVAAGTWGTYHIGRKLWQHARSAAQCRRIERYEATQRQMVWEKQQQERMRAAARIEQAARLMQIALIQLSQSPDFRRAATFAKQAKAVPLAFRVRQFRRFRSVMVEHFATQVRNGMSADDLLPGLTELVTALGLASYEADYVRRDAEMQSQPRIARRSGYAEQARQQQVEHEHRLDAIRNLPGVASELREQLTEQEEQRFRDRMLALGNVDNEDAVT